MYSKHSRRRRRSRQRRKKSLFTDDSDEESPRTNFHSTKRGVLKDDESDDIEKMCDEIDAHQREYNRKLQEADFEF